MKEPIEFRIVRFIQKIRRLKEKGIVRRVVVKFIEVTNNFVHRRNEKKLERQRMDRQVKQKIYNQLKKELE